MSEEPEQPSPEEGDDRTPSEFEDSMEHLGRAFGGVMSRLLGERVTGVAVDRSKPTVSAEADEVIEDLGNLAGRWLRAAGEGLREHPTEPGAALEQMLEKRHDEVEVEEGVTPLTVGLRTLAGGIYKSAEGVLDIVAPRRSGESEDPDDAEAPEEASAEAQADPPA